MSRDYGSSAKPTRKQADLADVLEMVLDKGIVINADIAITVGETEMIGIEIRAAIASFETAAKYGLAFPSGTDMRRVEQASGREPLEGEDGETIDLGIEASKGGASNEDGTDSPQNPPRKRPDPRTPVDEGSVDAEASDFLGDEDSEDGDANEGSDADGEADDAGGSEES
ncbi:gas vesicle protein GvpJ [Halalkalicoccus ordinarius]|uniref:gas vesicle protein GvpJ n=1 Tax=Halalkalicoccus ordinarius TaxID=3116651 RepID=UPI00300EB9AD